MHNFFENAKKYLPKDYTWLCHYIYHLADINNAIEILKCGKLYSRNYLDKHNLKYNTNTSREVLNQTRNEVKDYVRFYFRPLTPTQYNTEGLHLESNDRPHIPFPIFFIFSRDIIEQYFDKCMVAEKSLASSKSQIESLERLDSFKCKYIYHFGSFDSEREYYIKQYRMAEVIFKDEVDFTNLRALFTRSEAEFETFKLILAENNIEHSQIVKYDKKISNIFFYKSNLYVERVEKTSKYVKFIIQNYNSEYSFKCMIKCDNNDFMEIPLLSNFSIEVPNGINKYKVKLIVNDILMYYGEYSIQQKDSEVF